MTQAQPVPPEQWFQNSHPPSSQQDHRDSCAVLTPPQQIVMDPLRGQPCWMAPKRKPPLLAGTSTADVGSRQVVDSCGKHEPLCPRSSVHGFSKQEYWSGLPFPPPADLPDPGMEPSAVAGRHPRSPRWITQGDHSHVLLTGASERSRETTRLKSKPGRPSSALLSLPCLFNLVVCLLAPFFLHSVNKNLLNAYYVPSVLLGSRSVCTNFHRA